MGLGGRREKQVIGLDPRNTRWVNDTTSPGHRLLTFMGYDPTAASTSTEVKTGLYAHEANKRLRAIPIAKGGMEGIGYKPTGPGANVALGALPSRGTPATMASAASSIFSKLGSRAALQFVTAGASKEVINKSTTEGGEFGGLLARLNAASASATPEPEENAPEDEDTNDSEQADQTSDNEDGDGDMSDRRQRKKQRKLERAAKKEEKLAQKLAKKLAKQQQQRTGVDSGSEEVAVVEVAVTEEVQLPEAPVRPMQHWNASRSRNLRSKQMLHASAEAMAEILGISPAPSTPATSGYSTPTFSPATIQPAFVANPPASTPQTASTGTASASATTVSDTASVNKTASESDKAAEKLKRKMEKKAAKALQEMEGAPSLVGVSESAEGVKKKRKREA